MLCLIGYYHDRDYELATGVCRCCSGNRHRYSGSRIHTKCMNARVGSAVGAEIGAVRLRNDTEQVQTVPSGPEAGEVQPTGHGRTCPRESIRYSLPNSRWPLLLDGEERGF